MESHFDPRISTMTVNPRLHTSSLQKKEENVIKQALQLQTQHSTASHCLMNMVSSASRNTLGSHC